jgi:SAM-dependent methyltransferase
MASYDDYLSLQRSKLEYLDLTGHEQAFRESLRERLVDLGFVVPGATVLCLGARLGAEVAAFIDCGAFAVGVDLNPGPANPYVVAGDFHALQFADRSTDVVYSNSIDHAFDLTRLLAEVRRVLKPDGRVVLEVDPGTRERPDLDGDLWQALAWESIDDLIAAVCGQGFGVESRRKFEYPRGGTQVVLRPVAG